MKKIIVILIILSITTLSAIEIGGVNLPDTYTLNDNNLVLNGAGLRKKVVIKVYACGLYIPEKSSNSETILNADSAIAVRMHFIYKKVDQEKLISAWNEGFASSGVTETMAEKISQFNAFFNRPANKHDIYMITYDKINGTSVYINEELQGSIPGAAFRKAVFSIWLGEETALPKLRDKLLGR